MPTEILMPALSPTMEKGKLAKWLVKEGDEVSSGDIIAEIETDKATMEVEAVDEGKVGKILVAEGTDDVAVNTAIAVLLDEGESAGDIKSTGEREEACCAEAGSPSPRTKAVDGTCSSPQEQKSERKEAVFARAGQPHFRLAAGAAHRQAERHRHCAAERVWPAWPHRKGRRGKGAEGRRSRCAAPKTAAPAAAPVAAGPSDDMVRKLFAEGSYEELAA
jgi:pyruvate dehydrogenase E2 component (dihydrolipoamide acetyltransferase)